MLLLCPALAFAREDEEQVVKATTALRKLGATVERDQKADGKPVVVVKLDGSHVTDRHLSLLKPLTALKELHITEARVKDSEFINCRIRPFRHAA